MSYHIYTTPALVCGVVDQNQADRSYLLLTEALGMVWANARSVREERSRQRYALQPFSYITVSLIRGKSGWRIGSVVPGENYYQLATTREQRTGVTHLIKTARQYIRGEEAHQSLYKEVQFGCEKILQAGIVPVEHIVLVVTTRILMQLGYVAVPAYLSNRLNDSAVPSILHESEVNKLEQLIKNASTVSHL